MRLTSASRYALHAVVFMAAWQTDERTTSRLIADERNISERFLLKVLKSLVSANVLTSIKGPRGGYRLARPAHEITLLEVMEAVDGPIHRHVPAGNGASNHPLDRRLDQILRDTSDHFRNQLRRTHISDVLPHC
jgi:Rrf2 family protein